MGALLIAFAVVYLLYANAGADAGTAPASYTVEYGDTLWEIATDHYPPSEDPRAKIEAIRNARWSARCLAKPGSIVSLPPLGLMPHKRFAGWFHARHSRQSKP